MASPVQGPVAEVNRSGKVWPAAPDRSTAVARLRGVGLCYGHVVALAAVTLDIPEGRLTGLIGPDGVGKSSLLSLIAGFDRDFVGFGGPRRGFGRQVSVNPALLA